MGFLDSIANAIKNIPSEVKFSLGEEKLLNYAKKYLELPKSEPTAEDSAASKDGVTAKVEMLRTVQKLTLTPTGGALELLVKDKIDVLFVLDFVIESVDWKKDKSIHLKFSEKVQSASQSTLGRVGGDFLLSTKKMVSSESFLKSALKDYPYCKVDGDRLVIQLDQVPEIKAYFANSPISSSLANFAGVTQLNHLDKGIEVGVGLVNNSAEAAV